MSKTRLDILSEFIKTPKELFKSRIEGEFIENFDEFYIEDKETGRTTYYNVLANNEERISRLQELLFETESPADILEVYGATCPEEIDVDAETLEYYLIFLGEHDGYFIYSSN